jgi:hypothetical protein
VSKSLWRAVCDAGPVIHLDELGCIELLDKARGRNKLSQGRAQIWVGFGRSD